jgi:hypothetical protein
MSETQLQDRTRELHAANVAALRARPVRPCAQCGTAMVMGTGFDGAPSRGIDVFKPVAADGTAYGPAPDLAHLFEPERNWLGMSSPYAYLARLSDLMGEAHKVKRAELTWLHWRTAREYTSLNVRLREGSIYHQHSPAREPWVYDPDRGPLGKVLPYHCGMPAWLRPSGWYCRECRALLTDDSAEMRSV